MNYAACESNSKIKIYNIDFDNYKIFTYDHGVYTFNPEEVLIKKFIYYVFPEEIILSISNVKHESSKRTEIFNLILSVEDKYLYNFIINNKDKFKILPSVFKNEIDGVSINDRNSLFNFIINCINTSSMREEFILSFKKNYYDPLYKSKLKECRKNGVDIDNIKLKVQAINNFNNDYPGTMIYFDDDYIIKNLGKYFPCTINCINLKRLFQFIKQYTKDKDINLDIKEME